MLGSVFKNAMMSNHGERPPRIICPHLSVRRERFTVCKAGWPAILCLEPTVPPESPHLLRRCAARATYPLRSRLEGLFDVGGPRSPPLSFGL